MGLVSVRKGMTVSMDPPYRSEDPCAVATALLPSAMVVEKAWWRDDLDAHGYICLNIICRVEVEDDADAWGVHQPNRDRRLPSRAAVKSQRASLHSSSQSSHWFQHTAS